MVSRLRNVVCTVVVTWCATALPAQDLDGYPRVMQGPVVGAADASSFRVWVRMSGEFPVQVEYDTDPQFTDPRRTPAVDAQKTLDYCVTLQATDLRPATRYYYRVLADAQPDKYRDGKPPFHVTTAPADGTATRFRVAFGSCARFQREPLQPIWRVIPEYDPDLFFWLGDNVYADSLDAEILAEELGRQREHPSIQGLLATVPQFAIWDDHDFGLNNHDRTNPVKAENLDVWKRWWPNPAFGLPNVKGVFFAWQYAGVDFFFLDGRYHRDPNSQPDGPDKTMLGAGQLNWLKRGLKSSRAPFKVIVSGSVWTTGKGAGGDAWSSYRHERDALFDWIMQEQIEGVVLLSGDTHTGELNAAPWSERRGYDLYDLVASPLAQEPDNEWIFRDVEQRIRLPYDLGPNFGLIEFDLTRDDPQLTFRLIGLESRSVWEPLVLKSSELRPGVTTWRDKQSPDAARWMELLRSMPAESDDR